MPGRRAKYREFLHTLKDLTGTNVGQLAKLIGKKQSNVSDYLSGTKRVNKRSLQSAIRHFSEWSLVKDATMLRIRDCEPGTFNVRLEAGQTYALQETTITRHERRGGFQVPTIFPHEPGLSGSTA